MGTMFERMWFCADGGARDRLAAFAVATALAATGVVGQERTSRASEPKISELLGEIGEPGRARPICERLIRHGATVVPAIRARLERAVVELGDRQECDATTRELVNYCYVLGRIGKAAEPALAGLLELYDFHHEGAVGSQVAWAVSRIAAASGDPGLRTTVSDRLCDTRHEGLDAQVLATALERLRVAGLETPELLRRIDTTRPSFLIAVADGVGGGWLERDAEIVAMFETLLQRDVEGDPVAWQRCVAVAPAEGPIGAALWQIGRRTIDVELALLRHWDAHWRLLGIGALARRATLPTNAWVSITMHLEDADRGVRDLARALVQSRPADGLTLCARFLASDGADLTARIEGVTAGLAPAECAFATHGLRAVAGRAQAMALEPRADPAFVANFVRGCARLSVDQLDRVRRAVPANAHSDSLAGSWLALLGHAEPSVWPAICRAVTDLAPHAVAVEDDIEALLYEAAGTKPRSILPSQVIWAVGMEVHAGRAATPAQLRASLGGNQWHVATRAAIEVVRRGLPGYEPDLERFLKAASAFGKVVLRQREGWAARRLTGQRETWLPPKAALVNLVRALVLANLGRDTWREMVTDEQLQALGFAPAEFARAVERGELVQLAGAVAERCRRPLEVERQ